MRTIVALLLGSFLIAGSSPVFAAGAEDGPLARAVVTESKRLVAARASQAPQPPTPQKRSWIGRHPVVFGALAGTAGGAGVVAATYNCRSTGSFPNFCLRDAAIVGGALVGAGIGSVAGFAIGAARK
jgi:hypothetical protein